MMMDYKAIDFYMKNDPDMMKVCLEYAKENPKYNYRELCKSIELNYRGI